MRSPRALLTTPDVIRRIIGCLLAMLVITTGVGAVSSDYPTDLSKWIASEPPKVGDARWFAANYDTHREWVVFLQEGRPSVRMRAARRVNGSSYPERQESYPQMPFKVPHGSADEGLAGEWFSVKVSDGWIIGYNAGEWGAALWWFSPDGTKREKISEDQVVGFFETDAGLLAVEGLAHGNTSIGRIIRLAKGGDGRWHSEQFVDLKGAPEAAVVGADGTLTVATHDRLVRVHLDSRKVDVLLENGFWGGLYPKSIVVAPSGTIYLGMRHGVAEVAKIDGESKARWLIPNSSFDRRPDDRPE
jgi:hypothetical protein